MTVKNEVEARQVVINVNLKQVGGGMSWNF